ncbi:MAG: DNA gyrase inhibitor YacG [Nitrospirae bacterium]|nr:DNA gyrase inhibitor YacG [Nitrospirota bacterium]
MKVKCPKCGKAVTWEDNPHRPFCSKRCKYLDLAAWASGEYRIPGRPENHEDDDKDPEDDSDI